LAASLLEAFAEMEFIVIPAGRGNPLKGLVGMNKKPDGMLMAKMVQIFLRRPVKLLQEVSAEGLQISSASRSHSCEPDIRKIMAVQISLGLLIDLPSSAISVSTLLLPSGYLLQQLQQLILSSGLSPFIPGSPCRTDGFNPALSLLQPRSL
jgi:hypothetical protein